MCLKLRFLELPLLFASFAVQTTAVGQSDDAYARQLEEYDRRVAEQKQLIDQQNQGRWITTAVAIAAAIAIVVYLQRGGRRRAEAFAAQWRAASEEASAQNTRIIELLESIERNTRNPGT